MNKNVYFIHNCWYTEHTWSLQSKVSNEVWWFPNELTDSTSFFCKCPDKRRNVDRSVILELKPKLIACRSSKVSLLCNKMLPFNEYRYEIHLDLPYKYLLLCSERLCKICENCRLNTVKSRLSKSITQARIAANLRMVFDEFIEKSNLKKGAVEQGGFIVDH